MSEWKEVAISDVADLTVGFVGSMVNEYRASGVRFIRSMNVHPFRIDLSDVKYISEEFNEKISKSQLRPNDVVIVRTGQPGASAVIPEDVGSLNCSDLVIIHPDQSKVDPLFLSAYINLSSGVVASNLVGAVQQHFNVGAAKKMMIKIPNIKTQKRISGLIGRINDKIETNERINDILSYQLQTIYNQMFSKSLKDSEKGGQLKDICLYSQRRVLVSSLTIDTYYSTENMLPGKNGAVAATSLPTTTQTVGCMPGDVLVSNIRPYFKKIVYCQSECGCSSDVLCFVPKEPELSLFLFCTLYDDHFFDYMVAGSKGTKMPRGDKQQIMAYSITIPSSEQLGRFNAFARPVLDKVESNVQENKRLSSLRDTLLPRLMSGEIDVSNITV